MTQNCQQATARLKINLAAIKQNYAVVAAQAAQAECAAVVKADAYGLGMAEVVGCLKDTVETFFVAQPEEGCTLRALLPKKRIFVLHGFALGRPEILAQNRLIPVLNSLEQIRQWRSFCAQDGCEHPAALQFDTGMSRFGISEDDLTDDSLEEFRPVLLVSHLACADQVDHPANEMQRERFVRMCRAFPGVPRSLSATSGVFLGQEYHFELVRPGVALHGVLPNGGISPFKPVVTLEAQILQILSIKSGDFVGYGFAYRAQSPMRVATVGIGYADGIFRSFSGSGALWAGDKRLPVLGRVSMDSLAVDVTQLTAEECKEGDWLSIIGPQQDVTTIAEMTGTIGYEILTSLGRRFARYYYGL